MKNCKFGPDSNLGLAQHSSAIVESDESAYLRITVFSFGSTVFSVSKDERDQCHNYDHDSG